MNFKTLFTFSDAERELVQEAQAALVNTLNVIMRLHGYKGQQAQLLPDGSGMATLEPIDPAAVTMPSPLGLPAPIVDPTK